MKLKLTDLGIRSLPIPDHGQADYYDISHPGLCLRVSQGGSKVFTFINRKGDTRKRHTLGAYGDITLSQARQLARQLQIRPKSKTSGLTFYEALQTYLATEGKNMSAGHLKEVTRILTKQFASLHQHPISDLDTETITTILDALSPSAANHAYARCKAFLTWCRRRTLITSNPLQDFKTPHKEKSRDRILSDVEITAIWRAAATMNQYGAIIRLCILTGQRRNQIASLRKDWIQDDLVTFPAAVMKNEAEHLLPIGTLCAELITSWRSRIPHSPLFFASGQSTLFTAWSKNKRKLDRLSNTSGWVVHDLRRYFRSSLSRWKCCSPDVAERLIGHKVGSAVSAIYDRWSYLPEKREAVAKYEIHLQRILNQPTP
jgi:integrase